MGMKIIIGIVAIIAALALTRTFFMDPRIEAVEKKTGLRAE